MKTAPRTPINPATATWTRAPIEVQRGTVPGWDVAVASSVAGGYQLDVVHPLSQGTTVTTGLGFLWSQGVSLG